MTQLMLTKKERLVAHSNISETLLVCVMEDFIAGRGSRDLKALLSLLAECTTWKCAPTKVVAAVSNLHDLFFELLKLASNTVDC